MLLVPQGPQTFGNIVSENTIFLESLRSKGRRERGLVKTYLTVDTASGSEIDSD